MSERDGYLRELRAYTEDMMTSLREMPNLELGPLSGLSVESVLDAKAQP